MGGTMTAEPRTDALHALQSDGSAWPMPPQDGYTTDDFFSLDLPPHTELIDGSLVFVSPQRKFHTLAIDLLVNGVRTALPEHLRVRREMAVVLGRKQAPEPDLVVVTAEADADDCQTRYQAEDVLLAVEVVSPDSEDRDQDTKPRKYAAAGIRHYWLVRMDENKRPAVHTYELDPHTGTYAPTGIHHDRLKLAVPFTIDLDLTEYHRL
ncbi:Uma2 family endonuclease [Streptomyces sp. NPDC004732]|uniref:Uma2 family endonuclease n=1 Tax=Streptomyces sp. NPDC004732 TaxID=3154290 RepID=UPI0033B2C4D5